MLLVINNQNVFIDQFERDYLIPKEIAYQFIGHNQPIDNSLKKKVKGVILSGGRGNPYKPLNLTANFVALMNFEVPVMGFCLGHEIIAVAWGGEIEKLQDYHTKKESINIIKPDDPIFTGINDNEIRLRKRHSYHVSAISDDFIRLAGSSTTPNEIIRHKNKPIYGFQGHPEVSPPDGLVIISNFLSMCAIAGS